MSRRSWLPLAVVLLVAVGASRARGADNIRDGVKFNPPASGIRVYVRRTVDSTGTQAGKVDSAVMVLPAQSGPGMQTVGGVYMSDTTARVFRFDSNGNLMAVEQYPEMDANFTFTSIIANDSLSMGSADSSAVLDTRHMRLGTLMIECSYKGTSTTVPDSFSVVQLIVQVRTHLNAGTDSSSTFALYLYGQAQQGVSATSPDTVAVGHLLRGGPNGTPWSGEIEVYSDQIRSGPYNNAAVGSRLFAYPKGIAFPLSSVFGRDIYSPYTSVRVRVGKIGGSPLSSTGKNVKLRVHLVGTPL